MPERGPWAERRGDLRGLDDERPLSEGPENDTRLRGVDPVGVQRRVGCQVSDITPPLGGPPGPQIVAQLGPHRTAEPAPARAVVTSGPASGKRVVAGLAAEPATFSLSRS